MKSLFFYISILFIISYSFFFHQNASCTPHSDNKEANYNTYINKAELSIIDSNLISAIKYYKKAFKENKGGWGNDYYNAFLCAIELRELKIAAVYADSLAIRGFSLKFLSNSFTKAFFDSRKGKKFLKKYQAIYSTYTERTKKSRAIFDSLYTLDQKYASLSLLNDSLKSIYHQLVYKNALYLIKLIKEKKMPQCALYDIEKHYKSSPFPFVFAIHYFGLKNNYQIGGDSLFKAPVYKHMDFNKVDLEKEFKKAIKAGALPPHILIRTINSYGMTTFNKYVDNEIHFYNGIPVTKKMTKEQEMEVANNRAEIGLSSIWENRKKISYMNIISEKHGDDIRYFYYRFFTGGLIKIFYVKKGLEKEIVKGSIKNGWIKLKKE